MTSPLMRERGIDLRRWQSCCRPMRSQTNSCQSRRLNNFRIMRNMLHPCRVAQLCEYGLRCSYNDLAVRDMCDKTHHGKCYIAV